MKVVAEIALANELRNRGVSRDVKSLDTVFDDLEKLFEETVGIGRLQIERHIKMVTVHKYAANISGDMIVEMASAIMTPNNVNCSLRLTSVD